MANQTQSNHSETRKTPPKRRRTHKTSKLSKTQRIVTNIMLVICVGAIIFAAAMIISNKKEEETNRQNINSDANVFDNPSVVSVPEEEGDPYEGVIFPEGILENFKPFYVRNNEIVGWIKIDTDPGISYPVLQAENNDKYYRTNMDMKSSREGCIFMDYRVDPEAEMPNLILHGHNNKNNLMFGPLEKYNALLYGIDQYKKAPTITYYTLTEQQTFKIVGLIAANIYWSDGPTFDFMKTKFETQSEFETFRDEVYSRSTVSTGVDMQYGDTIMTLHTCAYYFKNARFLVVARKVRPGEDPSVDTSTATVNTHAIVPDAFYTAYNLGVKASSRNG